MRNVSTRRQHRFFDGNVALILNHHSKRSIFIDKTEKNINTQTLLHFIIKRIHALMFEYSIW